MIINKEPTNSRINRAKSAFPLTHADKRIPTTKMISNQTNGVLLKVNKSTILRCNELFRDKINEDLVNSRFFRIFFLIHSLKTYKLRHYLFLNQLFI